MPLIPLVSVLLGWMLSLEKEIVSSDRLWKNILLGWFCCFLPDRGGGIGICGCIGRGDYYAWGDNLRNIFYFSETQ